MLARQESNKRTIGKTSQVSFSRSQKSQEDQLSSPGRRSGESGSKGGSSFRNISIKDHDRFRPAALPK